NFSVAVAVGFIALFGVAVEVGVIMITYLNNSIGEMVQKNSNITHDDIRTAIFNGASPRVRPILMTNLANILGLIPVLASTGVGSDVMKPIAIPFVFGLITAVFFVLIILPLIYQIVKDRELKKFGKLQVLDIKE
ncbi:MAG TPA: efflux RND transporter permease subunit, partial [Bacteroidia bacterium]|nr:efflux RND transporter permease subunit [Bacteroidia bacterium]